MKNPVFIAVLMTSIVCHAETAISNRTVECTGNTLIELDNHIGAQTPFRAVFSIEDDIVNMIEGDAMRFSKSYKAHNELTKPDRPGYNSENGNLFLYKTSGRFEIVKIQVTSSGLKMEKTSGDCKPFTQSSVFQ